MKAEEKKVSLVLVFFYLATLVFFFNWKALGLSLYADDWIVISKFFHTYGPKGIFPYYRLDLWIANYGFQNLMGVAFLIFRFNSLPYYILNLICKTFAAFGIYLFTKKVINAKTALLSGSIYALSNIGTETTDWVYNFNTYLGIFVVMLGLKNIIINQGIKKVVAGWWLSILGYVIVPIRLFVVSLLLPLLEFFKSGILSAIIVFIMFWYFKSFFPHLGAFYFELIEGGLNTAKEWLSIGRFDFLLYPVAAIGQMVFPTIFWKLYELHWQIAPPQKFILYGTPLVLIATLLIAFGSKKRFSKATLLKSFAAAILIIGFFKLFTIFQGSWMLISYQYFSWTYFGLVVVAIFAKKILEFLRNKDVARLQYYLISAAAIFTLFMFQINNPARIFNPQERYLAFPAVGISLFLSSLLAEKIGKGDKLRRWLRAVFVAGYVLVHVTSVRQYYNGLLSIRTPALNDKFFTQIQELVPSIPSDSPVVFYFDYPNPHTYHTLLYSSFAFHMQLLYDLPYHELNLPVSVNTYDNLVKEIEIKNIKSDHIFALEWDGERFVDITREMTGRLSKDGIL